MGPAFGLALLLIFLIQIGIAVIIFGGIGTILLRKNKKSWGIVLSFLFSGIVFGYLSFPITNPVVTLVAQALWNNNVNPLQYIFLDPAIKYLFGFIISYALASKISYKLLYGISGICILIYILF